MADDQLPTDGWVLVEFETDDVLAEIVSAELWARGVVAVEELKRTPGRTVLRTSLGADSDIAVREISSLHPVVVTHVSFPSSVADTWREHAEPTHVLDDVWLVPAWQEAIGGRAIMVEPFDTFGLGNHPTTVLTLRNAVRLIESSSRVLDLGSGSGVLAVSLARLCGCTVDAFDIAPQGESALRHNAGLNNVQDLVKWRGEINSGDDHSYDAVMANILAPVLRELADDIQSVTARGGTIVLSGIRTEQVESVVGRYAECAVVNVDEMDGWAGVVLRRS